MSTRCFIIDDDKVAIAILRGYIEQTPGLVYVGCETNPLKALQALNSQTVQTDITFVDIQMPELSGLELAELVKGRAIIIFTTGFTEYGSQAFEKDAVDYLIKPFSYGRFLRSLAKAQASTTHTGSHVLPQKALYFQAEHKGKFVKVLKSDIVWVESDRNYMIIHLEKGTVNAYMNMQQLNEMLMGSTFMQVHKSFVINLDKITAIDGNIVQMQDGAQVAIGRSFKQTLLDYINAASPTRNRK